MTKLIFALIAVLGLSGCIVDAPTKVEDQEKVYTDFSLMEYMPDDENYMISPFSIKMAMMMAANGAEGETQKEIMSAFGVENIEEYNQKAKELIARYDSNQKVKISVANSLWTLKEKLPEGLRDEYVARIKEYFDATYDSVSVSEAVTKINTWVKDKTNGKIDSIISEADFEAALVNAIYFKGDWANQFEEYATKKDEFTDRDGNKVEKDFMNQKERFNYYEDESMQMVALPYSDWNTSMYFVLPKTNEEMDYNKAIENMKYEEVNLNIPKFKVEYSETINGILKKMGINKAFEPIAEFNAMSEAELHISKVLHKTFIDVDENGTEAAAVTAILLEKNAMVVDPVQPKIFNANKPFIYFIRDNLSGEVLFMGEIAY